MKPKKEKPSYWGVLPANVRYDKRLKPMARIMYSEITALSNKDGFCSASNQYFADLYEVAPETVSRWISQLDKCGHVSVRIMKNEQGQIIERLIFPTVNTQEHIEGVLTKRSIPSRQKDQGGIDKKIKENKTRFNKPRVNNKEVEEKQKAEEFARITRPWKKTPISSTTWESDLLQDEQWMDVTCKNNRIRKSEIPKLLKSFLSYKKQNEEDQWRDYRDFRKNFGAWLPKHINTGQQETRLPPQKTDLNNLLPPDESQLEMARLLRERLNKIQERKKQNQ